MRLIRAAKLAFLLLCENTVWWPLIIILFVSSLSLSSSSSTDVVKVVVLLRACVCLIKVTECTWYL